MGKGSGMSGELIFLLAVIVAIFGIYKYAKSETNDYAAVLQKQVDQQQQINELKTKLAKVDEFEKAIADFTHKIEGLGNEVSNYQEYNATLRESVIELRDKLSRKVPVIRLQGPIPVEIASKPAQYPAPKKKTAEQLRDEMAMKETPPTPPARAKELLKKTKKQIEELSK